MKGARWSVVALVVLTIVCILVGFVWLPSRHADFTAKGLWDMICRAAGVPQKWSSGAGAGQDIRSTRVVLDLSMQQPGSNDAIGRGATLALNCTMCHGPRGLSQANAPNLAGQYREVLVKQLLDYRNGDRKSASMQALSANLTDASIHELADYFASLPRPRNSPVTDMSIVPPLVRVGDPMRNVAPCASCHGGIEHKAGAPWLEGMPKEYLVVQLTAFSKGERRNDSHAQMRNMARLLSDREIDDVSAFYARHGEGEGH
jgi:cytochrome c553